MMLAAGSPPAIVRLSGNTLGVPGAMPNVHIIAPVVTRCGMANLFRTLLFDNYSKSKTISAKTSVPDTGLRLFPSSQHRLACSFLP